jgi:hypothetical protein
MTQSPKQTRPIDQFNDQWGVIPLRHLDYAVGMSASVFVLMCVVYAFASQPVMSLYVLLDTVHHYFAYFALFIALLMLVVSLYIGLRRHADVTPYFRRGTYIVFAMILFQSVLGAIMYFGIGVRPGEEVHLIYGAGTILALPFFIFVEKTAEKRPAMGSYMWGFALLAGIIIRCISTGPLV